MAGYETVDDVMAEWNEKRMAMIEGQPHETTQPVITVLECSIWMDRVRTAALRKKPTARAKQALKLEEDSP